MHLEYYSPQLPPEPGRNWSTWLTQTLVWLIRNLFPNVPSRSQRIRYVLTGVVLPLLCILLSFVEGNFLPNLPWQSGRIEHYVALLLRWPSIGPLLVPIAYSVIAMSVWTVRPATAAWVSVRLGIYTGVLVAALFLGFVMVTTSITTLFLAAIVGPILLIVFLGIQFCARYMVRFHVRHLLILTAIVAALLVGLPAAFAILFEGPEGRADIFLICFASLFYVAAATPTLNLITYIRVAMGLLQIYPLRNERWWPTGMFLFTWFAGFAGVLRSSLTLMMAEYAKLPTTDPNCYVSCAARNAHASLLAINGDNKQTVSVSLQTKRLKFCEMTLMIAAPRLHRWLRHLYDRFGPVLARRVACRPWLASITYIALMPLELLAECMRGALKIPPHAVRQMYATKNLVA